MGIFVNREQFINEHNKSGTPADCLPTAKLDDPAVVAQLAAVGLTAAAVKAADCAPKDGMIAGRDEFKKLFGVVDNLDHNGDAGSIAATDANGNPTPAARAMSILEAQIEAKQPSISADSATFLASHDKQSLPTAKLDDAAVAADLAALGLSATALKAADCSPKDGKIEGAKELGVLFNVVDTLDHNGKAGSFLAVDANGPTPAARVMSILEAQFVARTAAPTPAVKTLGYNDFFPGRTALTFDDGPNPVNTPLVLDALKAAGVKGTFFVQGQYVKRYPDLVRRIVAEGHTLGWHTWDHPKLTDLDAAAIQNQFTKTKEAIDDALKNEFPNGYPLTQARPPYGATNNTVSDVLGDNGCSNILWAIDSNDWRYKNDDQAILDNCFKGSYSVQKRGGVMLFHDIHSQSARVLPKVLDLITQNGIAFTTVAALLDEKYPQSSNNIA